MRLSNFSAYVPQGREHGSGHVALEHGQVYTLRLGNHWYDRDCDAEISIDGKSIGTFRIEKGRVIELERFPNDNGRFTFFKAATSEGDAAGANEIDRGDKGLVQVRFCPGFPIIRRTNSVNLLRGAGGQSQGGYCTTQGGYTTQNTNCVEREVKTCGTIGMEAGVTGLTGHSNQPFRDVLNLSYDASQEATITLRLVCEGIGSVRKLVSAVANPVPAAV